MKPGAPFPAGTACERPTDPEASSRYSRSEQIDPALWRRLAERIAAGRKPPAGVEIVFRGAAAAQPVLELPWFNRGVRIECAERRLYYLDSRSDASGSGTENGNGTGPGYQDGLVLLTLLDYLWVHAGRLPAPAGLVSEHHLSGGSTFFRGPHVMASVLIAEKYAGDGAAFLARARAWGGRPAAYGEFGVCFTLFPGLDWIVALWEADEEFPARAQYLFDRSLERIFRLDLIWALGNLVAAKLLAPD